MPSRSMTSSRKNIDHSIDDAELRALVQLRMLPRLTDPEINQLLQKTRAQDILAARPREDLERIQRRVDRAMKMIERDDVHVLTSRSPQYPGRLNFLNEERPPILFLKGRTELLTAESIAIIGARNSTEYGDSVAEMFATDLARKGLTIISGLARGIDGIAHQCALEAGGTTIAVLGCGIDVFYPPTNKRLQQRIADEGLLISEFAPGAGAHKRHFPQRNRIIALLGHGVLVVEAAVKSGTRITVQCALDYQQTVWAVPGPIGRAESHGTNEIIRDGGQIATCPDDVILGLPSFVQLTPIAYDISHQQPAEAHPVLDVLTALPLHVDDVARRCRRSVPDTLSLLLELELEGTVVQHPGKRFARTLRS